MSDFLSNLKRRRLDFVAVLAVVVLGITVAGPTPPALAVHDLGLFQLDYVTSPTPQGAANVSSTNITPPSNTGDDWDKVYNGTSSAFATTFITDGVLTAEKSFFTGGGSKDTNNIPDWLYDTVNDVVPDKDDIEHAFAAAYERTSDGHMIVYFGADRFDAGDGSAELGFWFFRGPVKLNPLAPDATTGTFSGTHRVGDLLILVEFVKGGDVGQVNIYEWGGLGGDNLNLLLTANAASCATAAANDKACAVINQIVATPAEPSWSYINKDGATTYAQFAMFEGGIDFTEILGGDVGCFSSFMAETRSSGSSVQAQLKDFALGAFPVCGIDVKKEANKLSKVGDDVNYSITIKNTGRATLYKKSIKDTLYTTPNPTVTDRTNDSGCGDSLAPGATCTISYTRTVLATDPDPLENKVNILYTEFATGLGLEFTADYTATVNLFQPEIALDKKVKNAQGTYVDGPITVLQGATVNYQVALTNKSSGETPNLVCTTVDANLGINESGIPLTKTAQQVFEDPASLDWCTLNGTTGYYVCVNTVKSTCTISDVCEDPQDQLTCLTFDNKLEKTDSVTVSVIPMDVALTVEKTGDDFSKAGDTVNYTVVITNKSNIPLTLGSIVDKNNVPETLDLTENCPSPLDVGASCTINYSRLTLTTDPEKINNEVTVRFSDGFGGSGTQSATWSVDIIHPNYKVTKDCIPPDQFPVPPSTYVSFRIDTENTGDAVLVLTSVKDSLLGELLSGTQTLPVVENPPCTEQNFLDGVDGCYRIEKSYQVTEDVSNLVTIYAKLADTYGLPNTFERSDDASCDVEEVNITRTWGFWKTHGSDGTKFLPPEYPGGVAYGYTCYVATEKVTFPILLGWKTLMDCSDVFGVFWDTKAKCSKLEQTKIQASRQFLAAILNDAAFETDIPETCIKKPYSGLSNEGLFTAMRTALSGNDSKTINLLMGIFACYNESYDTGAIMDVVPVPHADPRGTRAVADLMTCTGR